MTRKRDRVELPAAPQAKKSHEHVLESLRRQLSTVEGREVVAWLVIDHCGAFNPMLVAIGNEGTTAYAAGKRDIGLALMELLEMADGRGWDRAVAERRSLLMKARDEREKQLRALKEKEKDS